ncbi:protein of unknown function [Cyanobium sp. NIES-981]|nr:protein of unknown function [Cyanobium sp. NIES-981]
MQRTHLCHHWSNRMGDQASRLTTLSQAATM